jgi:hypothetical protein
MRNWHQSHREEAVTQNVALKFNIIMVWESWMNYDITTRFSDQARGVQQQNGAIYSFFLLPPETRWKPRIRGIGSDFNSNSSRSASIKQIQ